MLRSLLSALALPAALLSLAAMTSCDRPTDVELANRDRIFLYGNSTEPQGLDPHKVSGVPESKILSALFEGLVADSPTSDTEMLPGAAARWTSNPESTEWTFFLQPEGKWSDGKPVTAHDFTFAYERMLSPDLGAKYAEMLYFIENAEAYNKTKLGHILCLNDPDIPIIREVLEEVNFSGDKEIKDPEEGSMDELRARGLDNLTLEELETIYEAPRERFIFPDALTTDQIHAILDRLIAYHKAGKPDLWEKARVGVEAIDDYTLRIRCRESVPFLPSITRHYTWFAVPKHAVLEHSQAETRKAKMTDKSNRWTVEGNIVSNGPFQLKDWQFNNFIEVTRNPHYWDAENVWLDGMKFIPIGNPYTEIRAYESGQLHTTNSCPAELVPVMKEKMPDQLRQEPYVGALFLRANTTVKPLDDPRVREALTLAIDRTAITENLLYGHRPAQSFTPPIGDYQPDPVLVTNIERANQLLDDAGFADRNSFPQLKFLIASRESSRTLAEAVQAMWSKNLGIDVSIENKEWSSYISSTHKMDFEIALSGWIGDYLDPTTFLNMWIEGGGNNNTGWASKEYEALLKKAAHEGDAAKRLDLLRQAERVMMSESPVIPISWYARNYLLHPSVKGWNALLLDNHPYKAIRLTDDAQPAASK
ncbi:peptide ABC transporter substrate-binding protein [Sulfuriroseicoccus oceanibius]|uniref:Peptide ABC transporter substrate-binding protein n=1 Tax=Sulfuriroseicoccus oceanibius TaxID=2707525 RepID=A0A6B3L685_9BACT|nr:peptide ABC transporter substrate-binding protein [Sulfuriroseicoccus oceanibius]QQL44749.1 peptide ABC transporter substrate-binding protein [Sulfuriroseicoccus oceanibius]